MRCPHEATGPAHTSRLLPHAGNALRYFALSCPGSFRMISGFPLWRRTGPVMSTVLPLSASTLENFVTSREKMTAVKVLFG